MLIRRTIADTRAALASLRASGKSIGFVPTMGALHAGHISLVHAAKSACDAVVVSIFVNPTQFAPNEDFSKYPRTFESDRALLEAENVDLIFAPEPAEMYPEGATTFVEIEEIQDRLDGASRPGHFRGVATIVAKLFHLIAPDKAFFGQKDAAQVAVLRRMVRDLNFDLELVVCPTMREPDGLAMSSRNRYLSPEDRRRALALSQALRAVEHRVAAGVLDAAPLIDAALFVLAQDPEIRLDFLRIVDPDTLQDLPDVSRGALVAVAAWVGPARLIDNTLIPAAEAGSK
ncbi:MAG TPA: pantoate--beta-alanine ligase [Acidobacteriaceae bacterium]|jgi:pantoate--beta-alanine ligase|nr:pantoate--beta-alanine ligase [Acidobacteriaceae bacterium]